MRTVSRRSRLAALSAALGCTAIIASLTITAAADAQGPAQVSGVAVWHGDGFATLNWLPVPGATEYEIERTPVGTDGAPTGPAAIVGVWRPNRTVTPRGRPSPTPASTPATGSSGGSARAWGRRRGRTRPP